MPGQRQPEPVERAALLAAIDRMRNTGRSAAYVRTVPQYRDMIAGLREAGWMAINGSKVTRAGFAAVGRVYPHGGIGNE